MSWDIELTNAGLVEPFEEGGTYPVGGTNVPELNVTYNYGCLFDFGALHEKRAGDTIEALEAFVAQWGHCKPYIRDYWAPTPGNVVAPVRRLLAWAKQYPDGVWDVR